MGIAVLGPLEVDGRPTDSARGTGWSCRRWSWGAATRSAPTRWPTRCGATTCPPRGQGRPGVRRTAAQAAGSRGDRVGVVGLPPHADRRRAGPPAVRAAARAGAGGAGRRRPGAGVVPRAARRWTCGAAGPWPDLEEWEPGRVEAARLEGLRMDAEELLVEAETRRRARAGGAGAGAGAGRPGAVPGAALGAARDRAAPGRAAGRGPRRASSGPARCWSTSSAWTRAASSSELEELLLRQDPSLDAAAGARGQRGLPVPRAAAVRRRGRRLVLRPRGRRRGVPAPAARHRRPGGGRAVRHRQVLAGPRRRGRVAGPRRRRRCW